MKNVDIEKLGFSADNTYYVALRESELPVGLSPAAAAREMISELMASKRERQNRSHDDHLFVIAHWSDAASLLLEEPCKPNRNSAVERLDEKFDGLKYLLKYQRLMQTPEFIVCDIGSDFAIGKCTLPLRKQIRRFSSLNELNAYLPDRAPRLIFDRSSFETNTSIDAKILRTRDQNVLDRSKSLTSLFADIGELHIKCLHDLKATGVNWSGHSSQPCDLAAMRLMTAAFNYYCAFVEQRKFFQNV